MSIILFGIPNCNTVKKTMNWLAEHHIDFEFHNFKKEGISISLLEDWMQQTDWERLVNKKSATWRNLEQDEKDSINNAATAVKILSLHPTLIKRPVITKGGAIISIGFEEPILTSIFSKS